jgi:hypothetical protein
MNEKVVKLVPKEVGAEFRFDADEMLESFKGRSFTRLLLIAEYEDGTAETQGNCNTGEAIVLIERAKHELIFGDGE